VVENWKPAWRHSRCASGLLVLLSHHDDAPSKRHRDRSFLGVCEVSPLKLITFDAAGTLIDHKWDPAGIARSAAKACGMSVAELDARRVYDDVASKHRAKLVELERLGERSAIDALWQRQVADWLQQVGCDPSRAPEVLREFRRRAFGPESHVFALYDDALPALASCKRNGTVVGVISNWDHTLHTVLKNLGIAEEFDFVIASLEFGFEKPDERIFAEALERAGADADASLHVGDDYNDDFVGATNAGWAALLIDRSRPADFDTGRISSLTQVMELVA